jgi:hypothetical protein
MLAVYLQVVLLLGQAVAAVLVLLVRMVMETQIAAQAALDHQILFQVLL